MADLTFVADFSDLQLMRRELVGVAKDAKQSAGVFEREYNKVERQITRTAKASQQHYNELLKIDRASKSAANSADVFNRELGKQEANIERLKNKYVPLYAASKQYERAIEELNQAYVQGALTQGQYLAAMNNIDAQLTNNRMSAVGNTRSMNAMGMATQQVGYQVGDFLVQVQSGTNAMVAFGQQATQLVGVLPMMAEQFGMSANRLIRISAVLGIVIPLLTAVGAAFMRTRDAAGGMSEVTSEIESATTALKQLTKEVDNFNRGITTSFEEMLAGLELNIKTAREAIEEMQRSNPLLTLPGAGIRMANRVEELRAAEEALRLAKELVAERQRQREAEKMAADERLLGEQMAEAAREKSLAEWEASQARINNLQEQHLSRQAGIYQAYADSRQEADELAKRLVEAYQAGEDLSTVDVGAGVDAAAVAAAELAKQMGISLSLAQGMVALGSGLSAPGGPDQARENVRDTYSGIAGLRAEDIVSQFTLSARAPRGGSSGGGGGSAKTQEDYVGKLLKEAEQKRKLIGLSEEETRRQEILYQLKEKKLPTDDKRIEQIILMEAETRKLMEAEQQREQLMQTVTSNIESAFMSVVDGSKSVEDAFKGMLRNIILAVYQQQVAQPAATAIGSIIKGIIPSFDGGGFTGYGSRSGGMDGKGGMLAMVHPNETVVDHTKGQSMGSVQVVNNFSISANGDDSVKRIIRGEIPRITEATKAAVVDAKRRGGSYGRSF